MLIDPSKTATEDALEEVAFEDGMARYAAQQDRKAKSGFETRDAVSAMIRGAIPILSGHIEDWLVATETKRGRKPTSFSALKEIDRDTLSYIALSGTFNQLPSGGLVVTIAIQIGRAIMHQLEAQALANSGKEGKKAAKGIAKMAKRGAEVSRVRQEHEHIATDAGVELNWDDRQCLLTGETLLNLILTHMAELFVRTKVISNGHPLPAVTITEEAAQVLHQMDESAAWLRPALQPMVVKPRPWTSMDTGAYHSSRLARRVPLVRTFVSEGRRMVREALAAGEMDMVLASTNALQDTRFAIDTRVLDVMRWCRKMGLQPSSSFPVGTLPTVPERLKPEEWAALPERTQHAVARQRKALRQLVSTAGVNAAAFNEELEMAEFLADEDVFYIPHSLDFRGRSYAVPTFNHQRSDHMKALFRFADGVPLGADGGDWLLIHLANCGDFGKVSKQPFENRIDWAHDNEADILMAARHPEDSYEFWSQADSPFCFLQACFEYDAWMQSGFSPDFGSYIAGAADGSCSGLQHYAAIMRAEEEASHVNLVPRDTVGDIYNVVADVARPALEGASDEGCVFSKRIIELGFGRNTCKRNVMTYFYGSERYGMRDQHMKDTMRPLADEVAMGKLDAHPYAFEVEKVDEETGEVTTRLDDGFGCANTLATHIYDAVITAAPKADEAAAWIRDVAGVLAHEGKSMIWRTPTGMPVVHRYSEYTSKEVNLWLHDRKVMVPKGWDKTDSEGKILSRVQVLIREAPTQRVAKKRMRSASSPNVIHSMDGSHLQRTVAVAKEQGIEHFFMIHDSFGTHLGNMGKLSRIVRQALVDTYADYCPLKSIDDYARSVLSDEGIAKLPPLPAKGSLDLELVKSADYAFA